MATGQQKQSITEVMVLSLVLEHHFLISVHIRGSYQNKSWGKWYNWEESIGNQHEEGCAAERETGEPHNWPFSWVLHSRCLSQQELEKFSMFQKFTLNSHFKLFWNANIRDKILWNRFVKTEMCQSRAHLSVHSELKTITEMEKLKNQLLKKLALFFLFFLGGEGKSDSCCLLKMKSWFYSLWLAWLVILIFSQQNCLKAFAFFIYVFSQM